MSRLREFIFENEPVIGYHKSVEILYVKILRLMLKSLFSWPAKEVGENEWMILKKIMNFVYLIIILGALAMGILYIKINYGTLSFFEMGHTYITIFMTAINLSRLMTLTYSKRYRDLAQKFFTEFHLFYHKNKSEFSMKIHKQIHQICHLFTLYFAWLIGSGYILFNLTPVYNNYAAGKFKPGGLGNSTFELSVYLAFPFDITTDITAYFIGTVFIWVIAALCTLWFGGFDLMLSIMVFHLWGHFKILINDLESFPIPTANIVQVDEIRIKNQMFSEADLKTIAKMIKNCVIYHKKIVGFANELSDVFGPMLFAYYLYFQAVCCVLLLECSQMTAEALVRFLPLTLIMFQQLIQVSCIFEMIGTISEQLPRAVYGMPWEHMDRTNKKAVFIFLINVQTPIYLKAMGVINVGVKPMAAILKTSFSYFTFLRSF